MFKVDVYIKDTNDLLVSFDTKYDLNKDETLLVTKLILWSYWYLLTKWYNNLSSLIPGWFHLHKAILKTYNDNPFDLKDVDNVFLVEVTPIELPKTVEEMFK